MEFVKKIPQNNTEKNIRRFINSNIQGDTLEVLKTFPEECIDSIITSPPYYLLRDYQIEKQIGLERTYQEYLAKLWVIFDEIKRVLKKDGTCFVNLGDTFSGGGFGYGNITDEEFKKKSPKQGSNVGTLSGKSRLKINKLRKLKQCPAKSLMLIPHRFAIGMLDRNWHLRNTLIWIKKNAMPESVRDRWKKAHEYIFFFTKSPKYHFDLDAIRRPHKEVSIKRAKYEQGRNALGLNPSSMGKKYKGNKRYFGMPARMVKLNPKGAVPPDYLLVNTNCSEKDTSEHYASFPQDLIIPLIQAGCPKRGIILDPFIGSGTTGIVALKLDRNFIGIDIKEEYVKMANKRIEPYLRQTKLFK